MQDEDEQKFVITVQKAHSKVFHFSCRAKQDTYQVRFLDVFHEPRLIMPFRSKLVFDMASPRFSPSILQLNAAICTR